MISCLDRESPGREMSWIWQLIWSVINKSGAWYAYNGVKIGQGRENAKTYLKENPQVMEEVEMKVRVELSSDSGSGKDEAKESRQKKQKAEEKTEE